MTRDKFIEMLKENAEPDDLIVFRENGRMVKPSGVQRWSACVVEVSCNPIKDGE